MADGGVQSPNLPRATTLDSILGNSGETTSRQLVTDLAAQLVASDPMRLATMVGHLYETAAELPAITAQVTPWVINDPDPDKIGIYKVSGSAWAKALPLPYSIIPATIGDGDTVNVRQLITALPVVDGTAIIIPVVGTNTTSPHVIHINGGDAITLKSNSGSDIDVGGLPGSGRLMAIREGAILRLNNDVVATAVLAATEAARDLARDFANKAEDEEVETGLYSAKHWALKAAAADAASGAGAARDVAVAAASLATYEASLATEKADIATDRAGEAADYSAAASTAALSAAAARDAAAVNAAVYASISAGLAAVADGAQFMVIDATQIVRYRRDSSSTYTVMASYPAAGYVDAAIATPAKMRSTPDYQRRTASSTFLWSIKDRASRVALGLAKTGHLWLKGLRIVLPSTRRTTGGWLFSIGDSVNRAAFTIDAAGRSWLRLRADALTLLRSDLSLSDSTLFRGDSTATDVVASPDLIFGRVADGKWYGKVTQLKAGVSTFALVASDKPLRGVHGYGQSNRGPSGTSSVASLTTAIYPRHVVAFTVGTYREGSSGAVDGSTLTDLTPVKDVGGSVKPDPSVACGFALEALARTAGEESPGYLIRTDYYGGQPLSSFVRDTMMWTNLMTSIDKARAVAAKYGRAYHPTISFDQGENGPSAQSTYYTEFKALIADLRAEVLTRTGILPPFLFIQKNNYDTASVPNAVPLAQLDVAKDYDGTTVAMIGPCYQCPMDDVVHLNTIGRMIKGELEAEVLRRVWAEGKFTPLRPKAVSRTGAVITIDFWNPGGPLKFDTDWVLAAANYGFYFSESGSSIAVQSVAITGRDQVQVTLTGTPTGTSRKLSYARQPSDNVDDIWSSWRGQLYASSNKPSVFAALGYSVPADIRHYCCTFEETIS